LARQLAKYGIKPRTLRIGKAVSRGYLCSDFTEICRRYVPRFELVALKNEVQITTAPGSIGIFVKKG
jgi:hypothetical protein